MFKFNPYGQVKMGTTLIALKYNGGVIMACDSMTSSGSIISDRSAKKNMELSPNPLTFGSIQVFRCGVASHSQMIARFVFNYLNSHTMELAEGQELKIETVVTLFKNLCYNNKNFVQCAFLISDGKDIYSISSGGAYVKHDLLAFNGSGSYYVEGLLKSTVKPSMSFYESRELALKAVALAIDSDGSSGGNVRIVDIKNSGEYSQEIIVNREVKNILGY